MPVDGKALRRVAARNAVSLNLLFLQKQWAQMPHLMSQ